MNDTTLVGDWVLRIRSEYLESPGLSLTAAQAQRLWGLDLLTCQALLAVLEDTRFLRRTHANTFVRADR